jgi:hypothetical protein
MSNKIGIRLQRPPVRLRRLILPLGRAIVEQRSHQEILLCGCERARRQRAAGAIGGRRRRRCRLAWLERDNPRRLCVDAEVERELASLRSLQIAENGAKRDALLQLRVYLPQQRQIRERKERVGVVLECRPDEPPLLQIAQMIAT